MSAALEQPKKIYPYMYIHVRTRLQCMSDESRFTTLTHTTHVSCNPLTVTYEYVAYLLYSLFFLFCGMLSALHGLLLLHDVETNVGPSDSVYLCHSLKFMNPSGYAVSFEIKL